MKVSIVTIFFLCFAGNLFSQDIEPPYDIDSTKYEFIKLALNSKNFEKLYGSLESDKIVDFKVNELLKFKETRTLNNLLRNDSLIVRVLVNPPDSMNYIYISEFDFGKTWGRLFFVNPCRKLMLYMSFTMKNKWELDGEGGTILEE